MTASSENRHPTWSTRCQGLDTGEGARFAVDLDSRSATFAEILRAWLDDQEFRSRFNDVLAESPFAAFRWETPPVTASTVEQPFEFVLLESPAPRRADARAFAEHFAGAGDGGIVMFPNLGRDALMVVPCPIAAPSCYGDLAAFVRGAPEWQQQALWHAVGDAMMVRVGMQPVWLSTAGAGVPWLHVRLDDRPKYYAHASYRQAA